MPRREVRNPSSREFPGGGGSGAGVNICLALVEAAWRGSREVGMRRGADGRSRAKELVGVNNLRPLTPAHEQIRAFQTYE